MSRFARLSPVFAFLKQKAQIPMTALAVLVGVWLFNNHPVVLGVFRRIPASAFAVVGGLAVLVTLIVHLIRKVMVSGWGWPSSQSWLNTVGFGTMGVYLVVSGMVPGNPAGQPVTVAAAKPAQNPIAPPANALTAATNEPAAPAPAAVSPTQFEMPTDPFLLAVIGGDDDPANVALAFAAWADKTLNPPGTPASKRRAINADEFDAVRAQYKALGQKPVDGKVDEKVTQARATWNSIYANKPAVKADILKALVPAAE